MKGRADWVMRAVQYEAMKNEYESVYVEMNKER